MNYTIENLEEDIEQIVKGLAELRRKKGQEYADETDALANYREEGVDYCIRRIREKCRRCLNLLKKSPQRKKKINEEFGDIINISLYCPILYRQEKKINWNEITKQPRDYEKIARTCLK